MRPQEILARVDELEPGQDGVSLDERQACPCRVAVEARTSVGGEAEKTPEAKALIGDGVGDLVRQRGALGSERQEAGDQQGAGRRVVARGGWRRQRIGLRGEVAGAAAGRDDPEALQDLPLRAGGGVVGPFADGERGRPLYLVGSERAGRQRAMKGEVAGGADRGDQLVDLRTQRRVGEGRGREGEREGRHQLGPASHGAEFEVNRRTVQ